MTFKLHKKDVTLGLYSSRHVLLCLSWLLCYIRKPWHLNFAAPDTCVSVFDDFYDSKNIKDIKEEKLETCFSLCNRHNPILTTMWVAKHMLFWLSRVEEGSTQWQIGKIFINIERLACPNCTKNTECTSNASAIYLRSFQSISRMIL